MISCATGLVVELACTGFIRGIYSGKGELNFFGYVEHFRELDSPKFWKH